MDNFLLQLKTQALTLTDFRGHKMGDWKDGDTSSYCECKCGATVYVDAKPLHNGIDIGGDAVAIGCIPDSK